MPDAQKWVTFGIITDTHIDASYAGISKYRDTNKVKRNRGTIDCINIDAYNAGCWGVVHLGDMTDAGDAQNMVAFRQLYENDYPGKNGGNIAGASDKNYNAYSCGYRIEKPVFPTMGNHGPSDKWASYIQDRILAANGLSASYNNARSAYIWRWGQYYFINLGLWAGSYDYESSTDIDYDKLEWLQNWLAEHIGNSNMGVLIFQHYGWEEFSCNGQWWTPQMRELELDVLMRRPLGSGNTVQGNPYNVIGIFTGHNHEQVFSEVYAGMDLNGNSIKFNNLVFNDSGADDNYGFSIITLDGDNNVMKINTKTVSSNTWSSWEKSIHVGSK